MKAIISSNMGSEKNDMLAWYKQNIYSEMQG